MSAEQRLKELGIQLQEPAKPRFAYIPVNQAGKLVYTSGQDCRVNGELLYQGKVGREVSVEEGQLAARQCIINALAALKSHLGSLDRIHKVVKLLGFVNSAPGFNNQPTVMNGASEFLIEVFGEQGKHARSAIGTSDLPFETPVEIEIIVEIE